MSKYFLNDKYRVLECMSKSQILVNNKMIIKLSQQEIADILGFTKTKVNIIINELKANDYVIQLSSRGKYTLTEKAKIEISNIEGNEVTK